MARGSPPEPLSLSCLDYRRPTTASPKPDPPPLSSSLSFSLFTPTVWRTPSKNQMKIIKRKFRLQVYDDQMSTAVALFSADSLPPLLSSISLSPSPAESFLDEKVTKKRKKKKGKRQRCAITTAMSFHRRLYSSRLQDAQLTRAEREREREAERKRERIARQKRIRGIKGFAGTPLALPVQRTRTESGARGEREREKMNSGCRGKIIVSA